MEHVRDLKFHVCIPHEKIDPYFFSRYFPLKTKFEKLVCKISRKVFKEPSFLVYWLGLRSR